MYLKEIALVLLIICISMCTPTEEMEITPGVALSLAQARKSVLSEIHYALRFDIPADKKDPISGSNTITFELENNRHDLQIDFKEDEDHILEIIVNDQIAPIDFRAEHIVINKSLLNKGRNTISINFIAGDQSLNRNDDYLYTLLVPDRSRTVFPLFDQPNLKANFQLTLTIPADWKAQANGPVSSTTTTDTGKTKYAFHETAPISSYLFAFTAGAYQEALSEDGKMTMLYRETDIEKVERNKKEIFDLHQSSLEWLEDYTKIPFPFQKFDFALIPSFQYGGMEHVGAIFYNERSLMLDEEASITQQLGRASLIAHETAHMWFGDLVTMDWFDDVWLKEVFANFMAAKMVNPSFPEIDHELRFLLSHYPTAYSIDRSQGSHPIQQQLPNLNNAGTLYGGIIYQKAPIIMRSLEKLIGAAEFQRGLQEYLTTYSFGNATWDDLIAIMQKRTNANLDQWNTDWVKSAGMPTLAITHEEKSGSLKEIKYTNTNDQHRWPQSFVLSSEVNNTSELQPVEITDQITTLDISGNAKITSYNYKGEGYAYIRHHQDDISQMLYSVSTISDDHERAAGWIALWEELCNGRLNKSDYFNILTAAIVNESNPLLLNLLSGQAGRIYWSFMPEDERSNLVAGLEKSLWNHLSTSSDNSIKRATYNLYTTIATTPTAHDNLIRLWKGTAKEIKLTLSNRDKEELVYAIKLRDIPGADDIMTQQIEALTNPDDKKRMEFVKPALSNQSSERDAFFESLKLEENRNQERWVLTALNYLHHPLRQSTSQAYLLPSLEMIEEIQVTGDIFFPKRWLDNTLGDYSDDVSRRVLTDYLESHPELPQNLRNKIYQAGDMLLRAKMVREGVAD